MKVHRVNVLGPLMVTQAMLPLIRKGKRKLVSPLRLPLLIQMAMAMAQHIQICIRSCM